MARSCSGWSATNYFSRSDTAITGGPFTMMFWWRATSLDGNEVCMSLGNNGTSGYFSLGINGTVANDPVRLRAEDDAATGANLDIASDSTTGVWRLAAAIVTSTTSRRVCFGNAGVVTSTFSSASITNPTVDFQTVGALRRSTVGFAATGHSLALPTIWDVALSLDEIGALARGVHPARIRPKNIVRAWWNPTAGSRLVDFSGGAKALTLTGSVTDDAFGPPVEPLSWRGRFPFWSGSPEIGVGGGATTLLPTGLASTAAFGAAKVNHRLTATGRASGVAFGTAKVNHGLTATGRASTAAFGSAKVNHRLTATGLASGAAFGANKVNHRLTATGRASTVAFGAAAVVTAGVLLPTGLASTAAFGTPKVNPRLLATGLADPPAFGAATIVTTGALLPPGLPSGVTFGAASLRHTIKPTGFADADAFGAASVKRILAATGLSDPPAFGTPKVNHRLFASGLADPPAFGAASLAVNTFLQALGLPSGVLFGSPTIGGAVVYEAGAQVFRADARPTVFRVPERPTVFRETRR